MLDPDKGRARIRRDGETLMVEITSKKRPFAAAFLGFWLCGWAMGWLAAAGSLVSGGLGGGSLFVLFWLGAWSVGGIIAISAFLWMVAGRERISLSSDGVMISRSTPAWTTTTHCTFDALSNMRLDPNTSIISQGQREFWLRKAAGQIKVDYGVHTLGFGIELDEAEARKVLTTVTAVFPELEG